MPIRVYKCESCETFLEVIESLSDRKKKHICEDCGRPLLKLMTAANFKLNGTGWYVTDYKNAGAKPRKEEK